MPVNPLCPFMPLSPASPLSPLSPRAPAAPCFVAKQRGVKRAVGSDHQTLLQLPELCTYSRSTRSRRPSGSSGSSRSLKHKDKFNLIGVSNSLVFIFMFLKQESDQDHLRHLRGHQTFQRVQRVQGHQGVRGHRRLQQGRSLHGLPETQEPKMLATFSCQYH